jgi:hypothetical protein
MTADVRDEHPPGTVFVPCCVVYTTKGGPASNRSSSRGTGSRVEYTVKAATQRLVQAKCSTHKGWVPGWKVRPRLWRNEDVTLSPAQLAALQQLEQKQRCNLAQIRQQGFSSGSSLLAAIPRKQM